MIHHTKYLKETLDKQTADLRAAVVLTQQELETLKRSLGE
jgi:hypothetical protein